MSAPGHELVERALASSVSDDCVVILRERSSANLRWATSTLTTNGEMRDRALTAVAFRRTTGGVAAASVTGSAADPDRVLAVVAAADVAAARADPAEDAAELVADRSSADWADPPAGTSIGVFADFAPSLGEAFVRARAEQRVLYGFVEHRVVTTYLGSTTGLRLRHVQPTGHYACTGKTGDLSAGAWTAGATTDFAGVDGTAIDATLAERLGWASRRVDLPAGRYDTILPPTAVADLMVYAYWTASARVAHEGQSVFGRAGGGTRIGERLARPGVRLFSDPGYPGVACAPFVVAAASSVMSSVFDNGLPLARTDWIDDGRLAALVQTRHTAGITGQRVTPGVDNLVLQVDGGWVDGGSVDARQADLVRGTERGLLLTCLWYIREVDAQTLLLTGLTRDGVYLVEGGEITGAVNNFRFNESPVDLLSRFSAASATETSFSREWGDDYFSRTATPALRVPDFNMSSVSPAQ